MIIRLSVCTIMYEHCEAWWHWSLPSWP